MESRNITSKGYEKITDWVLKQIFDASDQMMSLDGFPAMATDTIINHLYEDEILKYSVGGAQYEECENPESRKSRFEITARPCPM